MVLNLIRTPATESTETASSEINNKACLIYYMATKQSIEHEGIYLKHGLNVGLNIEYRY